jgi:hypothetical protein
MLKRGTRILLLVLVLSLGLGLMLRRPGPAVAAPEPAGVPDLDIILVIDQSDTMFFKNDPLSWRITLAKLFIDLLSVDQSGASHRLGVVMFGNPELAAPLMAIQEPGRREGLKSLLDANNRTLGITDIPAALKIAQMELDMNGRPTATQAIILISDGICQVKSEMDATAIQTCHDDIRQLAIGGSERQRPLFAIALASREQRARQDYAQYPLFWRELAQSTGGLYFEPTNATDQLLNAYMQIIQHLFGLPAEAITVVQVPIQMRFDLTADCQQAVFTAVKYNPGIATRLVRPDGRQLAPGATDSDVQIVSSPNSDVFSVQAPAAGAWMVELDGNGSASVLSMCLEGAGGGDTSPQIPPVAVTTTVAPVDITPTTPASQGIVPTTPGPQDITPTTPTAPNATPTKTPPCGSVDCWVLILIAVVIFGLLSLGGGLAAYWFYSRPNLVGEFEGPGGTLILLRGRGPAYIGSDPKSLVSVLEEGIQPQHAQLRPIGSRKKPQVELRTLRAGDYVQVNGLETAFQILQDGDTIQVGTQLYQYHGPAPILPPLDKPSAGSADSTDWNF